MAFLIVDHLRHADLCRMDTTADTPAEAQKLAAKMHGRGFLTGQAAKKLEEAASILDGEAFEKEVLGAIVYAGMAILWERVEDNDE